MESQTIETVVCVTCGATNRAPRAKLEAGAVPNCGSCRRPLFIGAPHDVRSAAEFDRLLAGCSIPLVVDFWAAWCGPCRAMAPQFQSAAKLLEPNVRLLKVDTDALPELAGRFAIRGIPTMIMMHGGREVARHSGVMPARDIAEWAEAARA